MEHVNLPKDVSSTLRRANGRLELRDETGTFIGYFMPGDATASTGMRIPFTDEDIQRAMQQTGPTRTLDEIYREHGPK
jgi:hypothetical protein